MKYETIIEGKFLSRPNRFLAKVELEGKEETVHVKNTGRCRELLLPGAAVFLDKAKNPDRKTAYDLVGVYKEGLGLVNMDSQAPNQVVKEWLRAQEAQTASGEARLFDTVSGIRSEYRFGQSRMDFYFEREGHPCLMEVKGITLERDGIAYFPDAPTERGVRHIQELEKAVSQGFESYLAFVIQMPGISQVRPNDETHPEFGAALRRAVVGGVKVLMLECRIQKDGMDIWRARCSTDTN